MSGRGGSSGQTSQAAGQFNTIYAKLSSAAAAADTGTRTISLSPDGKDAATLIGNPIAGHAPKDPTIWQANFYNGAAEATIGSGSGAAVSYATAAAAQRSANSTLAGALMDGAGQGLQALTSKVEEDVAKFAQQAAPLITLQDQWGRFMRQAGFTKATNNYINAHPALSTAGLTISNDGNAIVEANQAIGSFKSSLNGIPSSTGLIGAERGLNSTAASNFAYSVNTLLQPPGEINRPFAPSPGNPIAGAQYGFSGLGFIGNMVGNRALGAAGYGLATVVNAVATLRDFVNGDYGQGAIDTTKTLATGLGSVGGVAAAAGLALGRLLSGSLQSRTTLSAPSPSDARRSRKQQRVHGYSTPKGMESWRPYARAVRNKQPSSANSSDIGGPRPRRWASNSAGAATICTPPRADDLTRRSQGCGQAASTVPRASSPTALTAAKPSEHRNARPSPLSLWSSPEGHRSASGHVWCQDQAPLPRALAGLIECRETNCTAVSWAHSRPLIEYPDRPKAEPARSTTSPQRSEKVCRSQARSQEPTGLSRS